LRTRPSKRLSSDRCIVAVLTTSLCLKRALRVPDVMICTNSRHRFDGTTRLMVLFARLRSFGSVSHLALSLNMDPRLVSHIATTMCGLPCYVTSYGSFPRDTFVVALLLKRPTYSGGNEFANMLKTFVSDALCVVELSFSNIWLQFFPLYYHFHP
jgi:hypothetical protein